METIKKKVGRKPETLEELYDKYVSGKEHVIIADCRNGVDNLGIARRIGCSKTTFYKLSKYNVFRELLKEGKEISDLNVESALYKRAMGYEYEETTTEVVVDKDGNGTTTFVRKTKKQIAPDTTAQIFWLKNRQSARWKDRHDMDVTVNPFLELMKSASVEEK